MDLRRLFHQSFFLVVFDEMAENYEIYPIQLDLTVKIVAAITNALI